MLLPLVVAPGSNRRIELDHARRARGSRPASPRVPLRAAALRARPAAARARPLGARDPPDLVGHARRSSGSRRGALFQGIRTADRDWIDRTVPAGRAAAFLWTGRTRSLHGEPERVLQPRRRPRLLRRPTRPLAACRRRGARSIRRPVVCTLADGGPVRDRATCSPTRRSSRTGRAARARQGLGGDALARRTAPLVSRSSDRRSLSERHLVGQDRDVPARAGAAAGTLAVSLSSDPSLFSSPRQ